MANADVQLRCALACIEHLRLAVDTLEKMNAEYWSALETIDRIRKQIIAHGSFNWSRDVYPLVAVLKDVGFLPVTPAGATQELETREEMAIAKVIQSARTIQEFLWGEHNKVWNLEEWRRMFRKRVVKIDEVDPANPHAAIELKKRLLQTAALAVAMIVKLGTEGIPSRDCEVPSNLTQYEKPLESGEKQ